MHAVFPRRFSRLVPDDSLYFERQQPGERLQTVVTAIDKVALHEQNSQYGVGRSVTAPAPAGAPPCTPATGQGGRKLLRVALFAREQINRIDGAKGRRQRGAGGESEGEDGVGARRGERGGADHEHIAGVRWEAPSPEQLFQVVELQTTKREAGNQDASGRSAHQGDQGPYLAVDVACDGGGGRARLDVALLEQHLADLVTELLQTRSGRHTQVVRKKRSGKGISVEGGLHGEKGGRYLAYLAPGLHHLPVHIPMHHMRLDTDAAHTQRTFSSFCGLKKRVSSPPKRRPGSREDFGDQRKSKIRRSTRAGGREDGVAGGVG